MLRRIATGGLVLVCAGSFLVACDEGSDRNTEKPPGTSARTTITSGTTTTTSPTATTTTVACPPFGGVTEVRVDFPGRMSSLVGKDVRTGAHPCSERFVIELQPSDLPTGDRFPGYWVRYATGPVMLDPKGETVTLRGGTVLLVSMASWMRDGEGAGYQGATDVFPSNVTAIREYRLTEDFEGQSTWAIGLDRMRNFTVTVLDGPPRLVVDVAT
jgi:hypothetical protein